MAKTNFVNGNPSQGIQGTVVTAEFLNALNNHRHRGLAEDGDGAIDYAPDTGAANAYVIALSPALTARIVGMPIHFMAANANTGPSTLNDGLGVKDISKNFDQPLSADDIKAGQIVTVAWDGVDYQMISSVSASAAISPVRDTARNLVIKNHATNPNYQLSITADEVMLSDGASSKLISALAETLDITASGVNGLDTGAEAASTWYHIWAIAKADGTKDCLLSASATAPTLPSGYTFKAYLGAVYNNASSNFIWLNQIDSRVESEPVVVLSGGTQTSYTSVSLTAAVPSTAKEVFSYIETNTGFLLYLSATGEVNDRGAYRLTLQDASGHHLPIRLQLTTAQTIYYKNASSFNLGITTVGWAY